MFIVFTLFGSSIITLLSIIGMVLAFLGSSPFMLAGFFVLTIVFSISAFLNWADMTNV